MVPEHALALSEEKPCNGAALTFEDQRSGVTKAATAIFLVAALSPLWVETDAYRFAWLLACILAATHFLGVEIRRPDRVHVGLATYICVGWAIYVALRYGGYAIDQDRLVVGAAEEIYLFAGLYSTSGYAVFLARHHLGWVVPAFVVLTTAKLSGAIPTIDLAAPRGTDVLFANNSIHASLMSALLLVIHAGIAIHLFRSTRNNTWPTLVLLMLTILNIAGCLFYVVVLNSKGVWLALVMVLPPALACFTWVYGRGPARRRALSLGFLALILIGTAGYAASPRLVSVAGPTADRASAMVIDLARSDAPLHTLRTYAEDDTVPTSARIRLQLTLDSFDLIAAKPIFGWGPEWADAWQKRTYSEYPFRLLHNSALEIAVRHGLLGLAFYGFIVAWALAQMFRASGDALVPREVPQTAAVALAVFIIASLTNSHIRLAIGESFMWAFVAIGFACFYTRQVTNRPEPVAREP